MLTSALGNHLSDANIQAIFHEKNSNGKNIVWSKEIWFIN